MRSKLEVHPVRGRTIRGLGCEARMAHRHVQHTASEVRLVYSSYALSPTCALTDAAMSMFSFPIARLPKEHASTFGRAVTIGMPGYEEVGMPTTTGGFEGSVAASNAKKESSLATQIAMAVSTGQGNAFFQAPPDRNGGGRRRRRPAGNHRYQRGHRRPRAAGPDLLRPAQGAGFRRHRTVQTVPAHALRLGRH